MADDPDKTRLRALEERIAKAKGGGRAASGSGPIGKGFSQGEAAWRMVIELVTGMLIGLGIGYGLDLVFGTAPIFLIVFVLLGFAAGIRVMLGTAAQMAKQAELAGPAQEGKDGRGDGS
jgi:ATP synthase protein I